MNKLLSISLISILLTSCGAPLKEKYDCGCDEIAEGFAGYEAEDLIEVWGEPGKKRNNFSDKSVSYSWYGLFDDGKTLEVRYHAFDTEWSEDLDPTSIVNEVLCCDEVKKYCNHAYRK